MPTFRYVAKDKAGKIHRGHMDAVDEGALVKQLQESGYWLTEAFPLRSSDGSNDNLNSPSDEKIKQVYVAVGLVIMAVVTWAILR